MKNEDYLAVFMFSGIIGLGCKMILSVNAGDCDGETGRSGRQRKILDNIPMASVISGLLLLSAVNILPETEEEENQ